MTDPTEPASGPKGGDEMAEAAQALPEERPTDEVTISAADLAQLRRYAGLGELITLHGGEWTEEDYDRLPEEVRAELHDGKLILLPSPQFSHQYALGRLHRRFEDLQDPRLALLDADVRMADGRRYRRPDMVVLAEHHGLRPAPPEKVLLVAEVVSPGGDERLQKQQAYAEAGIPWYLLLDPASGADETAPSVVYSAELLRLWAGRYHPVAKADPGGVLQLPEPWNADLDLSEMEWYL